MAGKSRKTEPAAPFAQRKAGAKDASASKSMPFEGAVDLSVDDFIDAHLQERPKSKPAPAAGPAQPKKPASSAPRPASSAPRPASSAPRPASSAQPAATGPTPTTKKITRDAVYKPVKTPGNWDEPEVVEKDEPKASEKPNEPEKEAPRASPPTRPLLGLNRAPIPRADPSSLRPRQPSSARPASAGEAPPITPKPGAAPEISNKLLGPSEEGGTLRRTASIRAAANEERISSLEDEVEQLREDLKKAREGVVELVAFTAESAEAELEAEPEAVSQVQPPPLPKVEPPSLESSSVELELEPEGAKERTSSDDLSAMIAESIGGSVDAAGPSELIEALVESPAIEAGASLPDAVPPGGEASDAAKPPLVVEETPDPAAHTPPERPAPTPRRSPVVPIVAAAAALLLVLAAAGYFLQPGAAESAPNHASQPPADEQPLADEQPPDAPPPDDSATGAPPEPATDEPATDEPATDEPATDEPATDEPATDAPTGDEVLVDETDGNDLLSYRGYLTVRSSKKADVYVQGKMVGQTNDKLTVRCGPRNVRIADAGPKWLSAGRHVQIKCMAATTVSIDPIP